MAYGTHSRGLHFIAGAPAWHARMSKKESVKIYKISKKNNLGGKSVEQG